MFRLRILKNIFNHLYKNKFSSKSLKEAAAGLQEFRIGYIAYLPYDVVTGLIAGIQLRKDELNRILIENSDDKEGEIFNNAFGEMSELCKLKIMLNDHCSKIKETEYFKKSRNISTEEIQTFKNLFKINLN